MRTRGLGVLATVLAIGLTGCTPLTQPDGSAVSAAATQSTLGSRLQWADGSAVMVNARKLDLAHVANPGKEYTEHFSTRKLREAGRNLTALGVDTSGAVVGVMGTRLSQEEIQKTGESIDGDSMRMGRYTPDFFVPFTTAGEAQTGYIPNAVTGGSVTDAGIVWGEFVWGEMGTVGWNILGVSPGSNEVRTLASWSQKQNPGVELTFETSMVPTLVAGRVYWHVGQRTPSDDSPTYQLLSVDFENPAEPREEALQTYGPFPGTQGVLAANLEPNDMGIPVPQAVSAYMPGAEPQEILRLEKLQSDGMGLQLLGSDDRGLSLSYDGDLFIIDPETRNAEMFRGPYQSEVVGLVQCGSRVSWSFRQYSSGDLMKERYVFDRDSSILQVVHGPSMPGVGYCAGDFIGWLETGPLEDGDPELWDVVTRWEN